MATNSASSDTQYANPMGTDGFAFLEFTSLTPDVLAKQFSAMGFQAVAKHREKNITHYQQGQIHFLLNVEPHSLALDFAKLHGPSVCGMGFRVKDAAGAYQRALQLGAKPYEGDAAPLTKCVPAIYGIGDSLIYLVDAAGASAIHDTAFAHLAEVNDVVGNGLSYIDHVTHNVHRGQMDKWAEYYQRLFNFREIRYFDIEGKMTGLKSRAMTSPCGKIRIPLNESSDDKSQIEEFLHDFNGEGIQHIALGATDIYHTVEQLQQRGLKFLDVPDTYYHMLEQRLPNHGEDLARLKKTRVLMDGQTQDERRLLLQIFTQNMLGPVFFEIIQRKGDEGFGEGNFRALFEAIERDQIERGVL